MFEKWRIKQHMEVTDAAGAHVGTVDELDGDILKLTRADSPHGRHRLIDFDCVDRIDDNRVYLKEGVILPEEDARASDGGPLSEGALGAGYEGQGPAPGEPLPPTSDESIEAGYAGHQEPRKSSGLPLFGTSGHGTGMGGSGTS